MTAIPSIHELIAHLKQELEGLSVVSKVEEAHSDTNKVKGRETNFKKEILFPMISKYFHQICRDRICLTDDEICSRLRAEGFNAGLKGFGGTPGSGKRHLFTKSQFTKSSYPKSWHVSNYAKIDAFTPYPDFSIKEGLLAEAVLGEVKYFDKGTPEKAVTDLYNTARETLFYLGAFRGEFDSALILVADASQDHAFVRGLDLVKPELLERFGPETGIHLCACGIT